MIGFPTIASSRISTRLMSVLLASAASNPSSALRTDIATQVKTAMDNAGQILKAAGFAFTDVVAVRNYVSDGKSHLMEFRAGDVALVGIAKGRDRDAGRRQGAWRR